MNSLGKNGRLGNQMFQYASLVGIAKNRGFEYVIPDHSSGYDWGGRDHHQLQHCFKMENLGNSYGKVYGDIVELEQYHFCEELFNECPDNVTLHGHFESYKYFQNAEKEIRTDYQFKDNIIEEVSKFNIKNKLDRPVCVIVRRGDFLQFQDCHPVCTEEYYSECISNFDKDRQFLILSDDIEWCKTRDVFSGSNFIFNDFVPEKIYKGHYDMCLSSLCEDFIISNSTFAWWCAWLGNSKTKKVYSPTPWFGPTYGDWDTSDLYPEFFYKVERKIEYVK